MPALTFETTARLHGTRARAGVVTLPHGRVETPAFMPVGTQATVKSLTPDDLTELGTQVVLANTYHLYLRPGSELVARLGGLHRFMAWDRPIVTDSGGFQVFSLGFGIEHGVGKLLKTSASSPAAPEGRPRLARVDEDGVTFISHLDGSRHRLTPEKSIEVQEQLGADIILAFDECTSPRHDYDYTRASLARTHRWEVRCLEARHRPDQALFGIVQGGPWKDLREGSARFVAGLPFDGVAIGGDLRSKAQMHEILDWTVPPLPDGWPRHLLGIGEPEDLFECIERGIDLFDCVAPTRIARHGMFYTSEGKVNIRNARFRADPEPVAVECGCYTCRHFSRAYLRHLFVASELLGYRLASLHNLSFIVGLVRRIRESIVDGTFRTVKQQFLGRYHRRAADDTPERLHD